MVSDRLTPRLGMCALATCAAVLGRDSSAAQPAPSLGLPREALAAMQRISEQQIRAHVRFLADDLLEGRGTGARGGDIAAKYIATQFALDGLKPAGDNGTYFQKVPLTVVEAAPQTSAVLQPAHGDSLSLRLGEDFVVSNQTLTPTADVDAPIVFVGYGIEAPEYRWNDFAGVDVRGKVVLVIVNEPPSKDPGFFKGDALTYYGRYTYKFEEAARKGAVGALIIHRADLASYGWQVVRNSGRQKVYLSDDKGPKLKAAAWVQIDVARRLFEASGLDPDRMISLAGARGFKPIELPVRFKAHVVSDVRAIESYNVVGVLPSAGAAAPRQAVIYSAHYDHLGIDPHLSGDQIFNGAVDNATGCGILLELARAFASSAVRPPQPVFFASFTAEEKDLLGSRYLGEHLPVPAHQIALGLNYDAILPVGLSKSVDVTGAERTSFFPTVRQTAGALGLKIEPDDTPSAGYYYRSDHFSLARVGVPAFSIGPGVVFAGHSPAWGRAQRDKYFSDHYHEPSDEYSPAMDFSGNAQLARLGFALGWKALLAPKPVSWLPGDEFDAVRRLPAQGPSASKIGSRRRSLAASPVHSSRG